MIYGKDRQVQYIGNSVAEARAPTEGQTEHILLGGVMEYCGAQVTPGLGFYFFFSDFKFSFISVPLNI